MERKFYTENFEKFLRIHADQFKMMPSKNVWHGIYNDQHPGRRWPSITMSLVFIFSLVIIGHLNTNNGHTNPLYNPTSLSAAHNISQTAFKSKNQTHLTSRNLKENKITNPAIQNNTTDNTSSNILNASKNNLVTNQVTKVLDGDKEKSNNIIFEKKEDVSTKDGEVIISEQQNTTLENLETIKNNIGNIKSAVPDNSIKKDLPDKNNLLANPQSNDNSISEKIRKVRKNPAVWTYYVTPSLSYRNFSDSKINNSVTQKPMAGYEAGFEMSSKIVKQLRFTTGLQLNYSGYNVKASSIHPVMATLNLNSQVQGQTDIYSNVSNYGNGNGNEQKKLKNYSLQVSVPIGMQYSFGGNDNIKFNTEAALQPTYIIASKAYLLSTDGKNYLTDPNIFRKWNMNTNLAAHISFKSNSLNWQIGPQIRYQLLSTYLNSYSLKEHLTNYGIRIGLSKISK